MNSLGALAHPDWPRSAVTEVLSALAVGARHAATQACQLVCGALGHNSMLAFERDRLLLRCERCGHESHGWQIGPPALRPVRPVRWPAAAPSPQMRRAA
jgi:hypothetical protein